MQNPFHQFGVGDGRCDDGGVAQGRNLVPEEGSDDDGTGGGFKGYPQTFGYAHAGNAHRRKRSPRGTRQGTHERTKDAGHRQKECRRNHLHAVINHNGNSACGHPGADQHAYREKNQHRDQHRSDRVFDSLLQTVVGNAEADGHDAHYDAVHGEHNAGIYGKGHQPVENDEDADGKH